MKISQADYERIMDPSKRDPKIEARRLALIAEAKKTSQQRRIEKAQNIAEVLGIQPSEQQLQEILEILKDG